MNVIPSKAAEAENVSKVVDIQIFCMQECREFHQKKVYQSMEVHENLMARAKAKDMILSIEETKIVSL